MQPVTHPFYWACGIPTKHGHGNTQCFWVWSSVISVQVWGLVKCNHFSHHDCNLLISHTLLNAWMHMHRTVSFSGLPNVLVLYILGKVAMEYRLVLTDLHFCHTFSTGNTMLTQHQKLHWKSHEDNYRIQPLPPLGGEQLNTLEHHTNNVLRQLQCPCDNWIWSSYIQSYQTHFCSLMVYVHQCTTTNSGLNPMVTNPPHTFFYLAPGLQTVSLLSEPLCWSELRSIICIQ